MSPICSFPDLTYLPESFRPDFRYVSTGESLIIDKSFIFLKYYITEVSHLLFWVRKIKKNIKSRTKLVAGFAKHMPIGKSNYL